MSIDQSKEISEKFEKILIQKYFAKPETSNIRHDHEDFIKQLTSSHEDSGAETNEKTHSIQKINKEKVFEGLVFHVEIIHNDEDKSNCYDYLIRKHGGAVCKELNENVNYEVNHNGNILTLDKAFKLSIPIVNPLFIDDSIEKGFIQELKEYLYKYNYSEFSFIKFPLYRPEPIKSIYSYESNSEEEKDDKKLKANSKKHIKIESIKEEDEDAKNNISKPLKPIRKEKSKSITKSISKSNSNSITKIRSKSENTINDSKVSLDYDSNSKTVKSHLINNKVLRLRRIYDSRIKRYPNDKTEVIGKKLFQRIKSTEKNILLVSTKMFIILKHLSQNKVIVNEESKNDLFEKITIFDFPFLKSYNKLFSNVVYYIKERPTKGKVSDTDGLRFLLNSLGAIEAKIKSLSNIYIYHNRKKLSNNSIDFLYSKDILLIINQILKEDVSENRMTKPLSINKLLSLNNNQNN